MEIVIAGGVLAVGLVIAAALLAKRAHAPSVAAGQAKVPPARVAPDAAAAEATRIEERLKGREQAVETRAAEIAERERRLAEKEGQITELRDQAVRQLERTSGLSASQAKALMMKELEDQVRHESARRLRAVEEETKRDAERRVRNILSVVMQRLAAGHAAETTVSVVQLQADDMKGRIIGREGRNIRALEHLTGVDFIIDDTPNAVILSGFDGVRREIARMTLEKLLQDGRIHPARIEETYYQAKSELESHIAW